MKLILTGGFLGSGKTTAIVQACQHLMANGKRVAVITNDQGDQQVDSAYTRSLGINTREVSNGCFCCRYDDLDAHLRSLAVEDQPQIVFAESVGTCTDLVATIAKPFQLLKPDMNVVISVFADASLLTSLIEGRSSFLDESVRYIYKKQLEEADVIVLNKIDLLTEQQITSAHSVIQSEYPEKVIVPQNSLRNDDVLAWIDLMDQFASRENRNSLTVDYGVYGDGEAQLAWLDKRIIIKSPLGNGGYLARYIIRSIFNQLKQQQLTIGHLKFFVQTHQWSNKISFTTASTSADFKINEENIQELSLLINARVQTDPTSLQMLIDGVIKGVEESEGCTIVTEKHSAFSPGFPTPTHRMG
jgi:G3E family GTPase